MKVQAGEKRECKGRVSIVICVHNEEKNIEPLLSGLLHLDHADYEIIFVDDYSTDHTHSILEKYSQNPKLQILKNTGKRGKKQALQTGINAAKGTYLLLTDADCRHGKSWINTMQSSILSVETHIVLGFSPTQTGQSFLSKWVHFENWIIGLQYMSFALRRLPYMGVGRNLLYRRDILSASHIDKFNTLVSGDDDLTVMQLTRAGNTEICIDPDAFVRTDAPSDFRRYVHQKRRHFSTAIYYKWSHLILLTLYPLSQILFFLFFFLLCANGKLTSAIGFLIMRYMLILPIAVRLLSKMRSPLGIVQFLYLDFLQAIYYLTFSVAFIFPKKSSWN